MPLLFTRCGQVWRDWLAADDPGRRRCSDGARLGWGLMGSCWPPWRMMDGGWGVVVVCGVRRVLLSCLGLFLVMMKEGCRGGWWAIRCAVELRSILT